MTNNIRYPTDVILYLTDFVRPKPDAVRRPLVSIQVRFQTKFDSKPPLMPLDCARIASNGCLMGKVRQRPKLNLTQS